MDAMTRNNVVQSGREDGQPMLFVHGFGCDQNMWRFITPAFAGDYRIVLMDNVGHGGSDRSAYDRDKYATLQGYATDVLEVCQELELRDVILVGHSVASMIGALAAIREPGRFSHLVMVGPSPRYIDDDDGYVGGFDRDAIEELLDSLDSNYLGWSSAMGPVIMGNADRPELGRELTESFCRTDPDIAKDFARVTFLSDNRDDLPAVPVPTLVMQCTDDVIAPVTVGEYVAARIPHSTLAMLAATGHCPNLSAPEATVAAMKDFLRPATAGG